MSVSPSSLNTERLLTKVSRWLRFWSIADGATITVCLAALVFWLSLVVDYLGDVWLDAGTGLRLLLSLIWLAAILGAFLYWIARRLSGTPSPSSLALIVERKRPDLKDRLLTAVEIGSGPHPYSAALVRHSVREAESRLSGFQVSSLFQRGPVIRRAVAAALLVASIGIFALAAPAVAETWARRVVLLDDVMYPRRSRLLVLNMEGPARKVARGRSFEILVESDETAVQPQRVWLRVRMLDSGERSRMYMTRTGKNQFRYVLRSVLEPIEFQVTGGDARTPKYRLETVEPPVIQEATVEITPPRYTERTSSRVAVAGSPIPIPHGSQVRAELRANKELVEISAEARGDCRIERTGANSFSLNLEMVENQSIRIQLVDLDGIPLEEPFPLDLAAIADEAPKITATRWGVSTAITPVASVPIDVVLSDDYGVDTAAIEYSADSSAKGSHDVELPAALATKFENRITLEVETLGLQPGQRLTMVIVATDADAIHGPKTGRSEPITFEIVTPEELLSRLATRELELRQRFEQVVAELREARVGLDLIRRQLDDPSEEAATSRRLNADRAVGTARKDSVETAAIATAFRGIVDELVLNRIGNSTLLERLESGVNRPMVFLVETGFPAAIAELSILVRATDKSDIEVALDASQSALDDLVARCEGILRAMAKLESFNEVVAMLRSIMDEQQGVLEETKKVRRDQIRKFLDLEE